MAIYNGGLNIIAPDISGKEDKSNKVTAWSSTTTDAHYPSEKLVKDALDTKVNTANVLTYEEIEASTDLSGKVASASSIKTIKLRSIYMESTLPQDGKFLLTPLDLKKIPVCFRCTNRNGWGFVFSINMLLNTKYWFLYAEGIDGAVEGYIYYFD